MASKKQKKTAEFIPLLIALGPTPLKKPFHPCPSAIMPWTEPRMVGRSEAEHIMRVLITSRGVVEAAAAAPALPPMIKSSAALGCTMGTWDMDQSLRVIDCNGLKLQKTELPYTPPLN